MATKVSALGAWMQTRNTLAENLSSVLALLETEPFSDDPASRYQQGEREIDRIVAAMRALAINGLKQIDEAIAAGTQVGELGMLAAQAHEEADRLAAATKTIARITKAVDLAVRVVDGFAGLPFV